MADLEKYQNFTASRQVLGAIIVNPFLLAEHKLTVNDFCDNIHKLLFATVFNLYTFGATKIDSSIILNYLKESSEVNKKKFDKNNGERLVQDLTNPSFLRIENFEFYYAEVRKMTLLRKLAQREYPVYKIYDPDETNPDILKEQRERLDRYTYDDILNEFRQDFISLSEEFGNKNGRDSVKAGSERGKAQKEKWKLTPDYGLGYFSQFFTTVTSGLRRKKAILGSAGSGCGKTRISVANLCYSFVPKYYDKKIGEFVPNPHGEKNAALYIGTEMELIEEIEPILWAYIADVPEEHIQKGEYEEGEEERVDEAIRILHDEGQIYLEYVPDYDIATLENVIDTHVTQHGVGHVFFDYIHITTDLIAEYQGKSRSYMAIREDQVLSNVGLKLKEMARKYNVSIDTWTQVNADAKDDRNRDANVIRGAKSLIDKMDVGFVASKPTEKEKKILEKLIRQQVGKREPNLCLSVYKNRGGVYNQIKIWLDVDYDTMRTEDLFVTDYDYNKIDMIKTYTCVDEDKVVVKTNKEDIKKLMMARQRMVMIEAEIEEEDEEEQEETENNNVSDEVIDEMSDENQEDVQEEEPLQEEPLQEKSEDEGVQEQEEPVKEEIVQEGIVQEEPPQKESLNIPLKENIIQDKTEEPDFEFKVDKKLIPVDRSKNIIKKKRNMGIKPTKRNKV